MEYQIIKESKLEKFIEIISHIEHEILEYYDIQKPTRARDFILQEEACQYMVQVSRREQNVHQPRAAVYLIDQGSECSQEEELFIGIYFQSELIEKILSMNLLHPLDLKHLDPFCVIVEELSHFHLIIERAQQNRQISQLELEWQGEVDKFLFSAIFLTKNKYSIDLKELQKLLFERVKLQPQNRYHVANKKAAQFWMSAITQGVGQDVSLMEKNFRNFMQQYYQLPLHEKSQFRLSKKMKIEKI